MRINLKNKLIFKNFTLPSWGFEFGARATNQKPKLFRDNFPDEIGLWGWILPSRVHVPDETQANVVVVVALFSNNNFKMLILSNGGGGGGNNNKTLAKVIKVLMLLQR